MQAHSSQRRPMQAHDSQRRPTKPTKANTGLGTSAPRPRRTFIGIFFSFTQSSFQSCLLTYVIIIFLGFNDVVNIVVIVYVDSEFLTTIVVRLQPINTRTPVTKNPWVDGFGFPWVRVRVTKHRYLNFNSYEGFYYLSLCMKGFFYGTILAGNVRCFSDIDAIQILCVYHHFFFGIH